jgi:hypothetical protein
MRIALWIASPPTCSVRTPRASLTAMADPRREPLTPLNAARRARCTHGSIQTLCPPREKNALPLCFGASISYPRLYPSVFVSRLSSDSAWCGLEEKASDWLKKHM